MVALVITTIASIISLLVLCSFALFSSLGLGSPSPDDGLVLLALCAGGGIIIGIVGLLRGWNRRTWWPASWATLALMLVLLLTGAA